jgi:hypothetical protein
VLITSSDSLESLSRSEKWLCVSRRKTEKWLCVGNQVPTIQVDWELTTGNEDVLAGGGMTVKVVNFCS